MPSCAIVYWLSNIVVQLSQRVFRRIGECNLSDINFHQRVGDSHLVGVELDDGSALVYFHERGPSLVPVEIRMSSAALKIFKAGPLTEFIKNTPDLSKLPRLTSHQLRKISLSEVTAKLRAMISDVSQLDSSISDSDAIFIFKNKTSEYGFRNARDLQAAVDRLRAAFIYVHRINSGDSKPLVAISEELSLPVSRARALIAGARRDGFLTAESPGLVGGSLTPKALELASMLQQNVQGGNK